MDKRKKVMNTIILIVIFFPLFAIILLNIIVVVANNAIAKDVENNLKNISLPEKTEIVSSISIAGKVVGNGNGMQYFGSILVKSELNLEELNEYYSKYGDMEVREQKSKNIDVLDHGEYSFDISDEELANCYIVYDWGHTENDILYEFDLRGH